jgi:hypothetical protein
MAPVLSPPTLTIQHPPADRNVMPPVLAVLFWTWLVVSVVIIVRRRVTKRASARTDVDPELGSPPDLDVTDAAEPAREPAPIEAMAHATAGADPTIAFGASAPPPTFDAEASVASTPPPGFEGPEAQETGRPLPRSAPAAGVADALAGIQMPCDLVPLVLDRLASDRITLSTTGYPAEAVGTALADEVERLGYALRPMSDHELLATRGATGLRLTIRPPDADGRHFEHPTAREDSVVVEIALL